MVQYNPQPTALAWGAFRFILIAAVQEGETSGKLVESLDCISRIIFRADEYTRLFAHQEISTKQILQHLHGDLVQLFSEVLFFLFQAKAFFEKRSFRKLFGSNRLPQD
ncbi:hypothetical protein BDD12DRAFT_829856 [Trichophaea hybrida]|nr:hypothetical protein BDD12DRAFT_829856 [Trichophaea hybrida]